MSITYQSAGATADSTSSITAALPASAAAGQLAILQVVSGHPNDSVPSTPSGWSLAGSFSDGGGTFGLNTGPRRLTWFVRELTGGDAAPTTQIPSGSSGSVIGGFVFTLARTAGTGWRWASTFGEDTTSGTAFSAPCTTAITWAPGDFAVLGWGLATQTAGPGSPGVTATGITFAAVDTHGNSQITSGNGARVAMRSTSVTAGTGSQAPTVTATLTAASTGVGSVLRIREASSDVTASPQSVFPPRNLVSVTGLKADDITSVSVFRQYNTDLTPVRAASGIDTTGADVLLRVDAEQPFGVSINYAATLTDVNGNSWQVFSGPITSTVDGDVISDAVQGTGAKVFIENWDDKKRTRDASIFNVGGRLVVVGKPRSAAQATVTVSTDTDDDGDALQGVLNAATEGVILIRKQVTHPGVDGHLALLDDDERRTWSIPYRLWDLSTAETEPWPDSLEAAGFTLQDIANNYSTLSDLAADFSSLLAIALFDFGN